MEGPQVYTLMTGVRFSCRLLWVYSTGARGVTVTHIKRVRLPSSTRDVFRGILIGLLILAVLYGGLLLYYR